MHIAQVNIAKMKWPIDDPRMVGFTNNLEPINALADKHEGFVWRLKGEENNATAIRVFENNYLIINLSVWDNLESLFDFIYKTDHKQFIRDKKQWFNSISEMHMALWYAKEGQTPTPAEARERLAYLNEHGDSPYAFRFQKRFSENEYLHWLENKKGQE